MADSVPSKVVRQWKREFADIPDDKQRSKQLHRQIAKYEDAGHGEILLRDPVCALILQNILIQDHCISYKLIAWVIMPNHVHVMIRISDGFSLTSIIQRWKGTSAIEINRHLKRKGKLWESDYYDRYIRDMDHYHDSLAYIRNNPVKAKLCEQPENWPYSSAGVSWSADFSPLESASGSDTSNNLRAD